MATRKTLKRLGLDLPLGELSFKEGEARTRPPFSVEWIKTRLLKPGALDGLNGEARAILLGMVNTGYRPSEGAALRADTIRLDCDIPHIQIRPDGRQVKSAYAKRDIPLTGVSLEAFKAFPEGFPRYRDNPGLSATVNSFLRENGLMESERHSFYSLRHSFEDHPLHIAEFAPETDCPGWLNFLEFALRNDPETIRFLRQWAGMSLTGRTTEQKLLFIHGGGGNGKGVAINTMAWVTGDYAANVPSATLTATTA